MVAITDKFGKASSNTDHAVATTVKTTRSSGVLVLECFDLSKFATDTPVFFVTYKKSIDPLSGDAIVTNLVSWKALVNTGTNTLTNLTIAPGYTDAGNAIGDFVECVPTSYWENSLVDGILVTHNEDGTLKDNVVTTDTVADGAITSAKLGLSKTTDANGWEIYDYGTWKEYSKQYTGTSASIPGNNGVALFTANLPTGFANRNNVVTTFSSYVANQEVYVNMTSSDSAASINFRIYNNAASALTPPYIVHIRLIEK